MSLYLKFESNFRDSNKGDETPLRGSFGRKFLWWCLRYFSHWRVPFLGRRFNLCPRMETFLWSKLGVGGRRSRRQKQLGRCRNELTMESCRAFEQVELDCGGLFLDIGLYPLERCERWKASKVFFGMLIEKCWLTFWIQKKKILIHSWLVQFKNHFEITFHRFSLEKPLTNVKNSPHQYQTINELKIHSQNSRFSVISLPQPQFSRKKNVRKSSAISRGGTIIWPPFIEITQSTTYRHIINNKQNCRNNSEPSPHLALFWWGGGKSSNQQPLFSGSIIHRAQAGKAENNIPRGFFWLGNLKFPFLNPFGKNRH